ncbi:MAG: cell division topological specificity factor MinE [Arsenophonus sp.]|nr:MAG: cell division topological specificity factor MinE [Arsenophonus sp.]
MALLDFFLSKKKSTANIAKERLQIIIAERKRNDCRPTYLDEMKRDILKVICKYVKINPEMLSIQFEQKDDDISVLELNVTLPDIDANQIKNYIKQ